ncbi:MAG: DoxX family protein [Candidatus Binatia bacterium]
MNSVVIASQLVIALGLLNVWLLRTGKPSAWRGGEARNMREEFAFYGLPQWFMWLVGFFKISLATLLIVGLWVPSFARPAALGVAVLMIGAVAMHFKVSDPWKRALPASSLLVLALIVAVS